MNNIFASIFLIFIILAKNDGLPVDKPETPYQCNSTNCQQNSTTTENSDEILPDSITTETPFIHELFGEDDKNDTKELCGPGKEDKGYDYDYDYDYDLSKEENNNKEELCKDSDTGKSYECEKTHEALKKLAKYHDRHHCKKKIYKEGKWYCVYEEHGWDWHDWDMEEIDWPEDHHK